MNIKRFILLIVICLAQTTAVAKQSGDAVEKAGQVVKEGGSGILHTGEGDINITGYTIEQHQKVLEKEKQALRKDLERLHKARTKGLLLEKQILEKRLSKIESQLANIKQSHKQRITFLENTIKELRAFAGEVDAPLLQEAEAALKKGDTDKADQLFARIEAREKQSIERAAKAAFERGKIAEEKIDYHKAFEHFARAVGLSPQNADFLSWAGSMAGTLARHNKEIEWKEKALKIYLESEGETGANVATLRNNLGAAWRAKGDYDKAIGCYEAALASVLKTFGEGHPKVAICRNNMGKAWHSKGDYDKAIGYYEQALRTFRKILGDHHPSTRTVQGNLASARAAAAK